MGGSLQDFVNASIHLSIVIPGRIEDANPESRGSGFDASHRPGMTVIR
jgi:hypothetical protein